MPDPCRMVDAMGIPRGNAGKIILYTVKEKGQLPQQLLMTNPVGDLHNFGNVLGRVPSPLRTRLEGILASKLRYFKHAKDEKN